MNYLPMNAELRRELLARGFTNTIGCRFEKPSDRRYGRITLYVWLHTNGGQAEVNRRVSGGRENHVSRLDHFSTIEEIDQFFEPYTRAVAPAPDAPLSWRQG